ncbi:hypothetical protein [Leifsonia sp. fls2-241-R2A-40a]|uniref:hypothetical protein n=1 Tax=Leifsonia sp. fls2-241-R2A-40a TaxID=3040290 RepID=UPI00254C0E15|nr:hypothetical protein [Leifsonia sp. fls2-241-R2A-40a]
MTEPGGDAGELRQGRQPSLTMQRIAIRRERIFGWLYVVIGVVGLAIAVALFLVSKTGDVALHVAQLILWAAFLATGIGRLIRARTHLRRFEAEHGVGAGEQ